MKSDQTFKRKKKQTAVVLKAATSRTFIRKANRNPSIPRTMKQKDIVTVKTVIPSVKHIGLRTSEDSYRSLKRDSAIPVFPDWDDTSRSEMIQVVESWGNTPSNVLARILGATPGQIGAIRRWHIRNWRNLGNQYLNSEYYNSGVVI